MSTNFDGDAVNELAESYDPHEVEDLVNEFWDEVNAYNAARKSCSEHESYYFLDGPPFTSGQMHLGTAWNKILKDTAIRYLRMQGYAVNDQLGYDMHGLPIETKVEEKFGFTTKKDIEEHGVGTFVEECRTFAEENLQKMNEDFQSLGIWMDWENPYRTMSNEYIQGVWWGFKRANERGLVEKGSRVTSQCPRCETAIADNEVEYEEITSPSIYVKFPLENDDASLVIWTTTPWTIPANLYVAVEADVEYSRVRAEKDGESEELIVATECVEDVLKEARYSDYEILKTFTGDEIEGRRYEHPLIDQVPEQHEYHELDDHHQVYTTDFVEVERTGLVHAAPGHGMEDAEFAEEVGLKLFSPVGTDGVFTGEAGEYRNMFVRDANEDIVDDLEETGALLANGTTQHRYGHCWRCDTPIVFVATDQWYIRVTRIREQLLDELDRSKWHPQWARDRRQRDWIENAQDWCVSRQRYWGTPMPIWEAENGDRIVIGTLDELIDRADQDIFADEIDLHRPEIDEITITEDDKTYTRVPDVFDVWVDSGVTAWASVGYPNMTDRFEDLWPADLIIEAHDQTRGWFWSQLGMGVVAFDEIPYREVVMHGHALAEDGRKMSKSLGNIVTPQEAIDRHGADPVRTFLLTRNLDGEDMRFSWEEIEDQQRRLNIVWNTFRFPLPYMRMDGFDPGSASPADCDLTALDRWVLSRLESTKRTATDHMEEFEMPEALRSILSFLLDDVSRYYIQSIRGRVWQEAENPDKEAAYATLYRVLEESARLLAPYAPHVAEKLYQVVDGEATTVHQLEWPTYREDSHDPELEENFSDLREVEEAISTARNQTGRGLRWPVKRVVVVATDDGVIDSVEALSSLLTDRVNTRKIEVTSGTWDELETRVEPQMEALGPAFGDEAPQVAEAVRENDTRRLQETLTVEVSGNTYELTEDMVEFEKVPPSYAVAADFEDGTVYVDTTTDEAILSEGYAREIIRRIQEMRKDLDLEIDRRIDVELAADEEIATYVEQCRELVATETRADEVTIHSCVDSNERIYEEHEHIKLWEIDDMSVRIGVITT